MIAYFDTSSLVPLVVQEPSTTLCRRLWNESSRVMSCRLWYPEARAALARAERMQRLTSQQRDHAVAELETIAEELDVVELTAGLARRAGDVAQDFGLRGFDAVHVAAAQLLDSREVVMVTGDRELATAAAKCGLAVAITS